MVVDLRQFAFATLWKKYEKKINTNTVKEDIRNGTATFKFADYCNVTTKDYTTTKYKKDGEIIELDTAEIIANYCKDNGIEITKVTKENYSIEFVPSEKAIKEFDKMIKELETSQYKNIAKVASNVAEHK